MKTIAQLIIVSTLTTSLIGCANLGDDTPEKAQSMDQSRETPKDTYNISPDPKPSLNPRKSPARRNLERKEINIGGGGGP